MKRIIFLIIASLLVIGLVLPGCTPAEENIIKIAVVGPMDDVQGEHHMYGAEMARDEINAAGGVTINSTKYTIELVEIDTNEVLSPSGADGVTAMSAQIGNVDFIIGGFRTEAVAAYREVAMDAGKIFIDCGAATGALQFSVVSNYSRYKYWFKGTPPNELFLTQSNSKLLSMILAMTTGYKAAVTMNASAEYIPKIAILAEDAVWTLLSREAALAKFQMAGYSVGQGLWLVNPTAAGIMLTLGGINAASPDIIYTILSGPVGMTYAKQVGVIMPDVLSVGINVEAQRVGFPAVAQYAEGMIFLDSYAPGVNLTAKTDDFLDAFDLKTTGEWPIYTAATYDAVLSLAETIDAEDSLSTAVLIPAMEDTVRLGTSGTSGYYPLWDTTTEGTHPFGPPLGYPVDTPALNELQVLDLYPWLTGAKYWDGAASILNWTYSADDWTMLPHTSHDLVYGTEWVTALASQWQDVEGTLTKVGVWPKAYLAGLPTDQATWLAIIGGIDVPTMGLIQTLGLWDQYGWWHFEYPGTGTVDLTDWWTWLATGW